MLDVRLAATSLAIWGAVMSVALAEPVKDQPQPAAQSSGEARPIRVVLPAPWEPSQRQAETQLPK